MLERQLPFRHILRVGKLFAAFQHIHHLVQRATGVFHQLLDLADVHVAVLASFFGLEPQLDGDVVAETPHSLEIPVAGFASHYHVRAARLDDVLRGEAAFGIQGGYFVEMPQDAPEHHFEAGRIEKAVLRLYIVVFGFFRHRTEKIEHLEDGLSLGGRYVGDGRGAGVAEVLPEEAAGVVVLETEDLLAVLLLEVYGRLGRELLEHELLHRDPGLSVDAGFRVQFRGRVGGRIVVASQRRAGLSDVGHGCGKVFMPRLEKIDEPQAFLEVLGVLHEAPAVVHQAIRLRAGRRDLAHRLRLVHARRLGEELRRPRQLRKLALDISRLLRDGQRLRLDRFHVLLLRERRGRAVRVDRVLDGDDASGGERLALAEVLELHRVLDTRRDLFGAAEHIRDSLLEERAHFVVHVARCLEASDVADEVERGLRDDRPARERTGAGGFVLLAADLREGRTRLRMRREVSKRPERCVVSVDVKCHSFTTSSLKL